MVSRETLESYSVGDLRKEVAKTNMKGVTKLKKSELIDAMLKVKDGRFDHLEKKVKKPKGGVIGLDKDSRVNDLEKAFERREVSQQIDAVTAKINFLNGVLANKEMSIKKKLKEIKSTLVEDQMRSTKWINKKEDFSPAVKLVMKNELRKLYPMLNKEIRKANTFIRKNPEALKPGEEGLQYPLIK